MPVGVQEYNWGGLLAFVLQAYAHRRPDWSGEPCGRGLNAAHVLQLMLLALKVADVQFRCAWLPWAPIPRSHGAVPLSA